MKIKTRKITEEDIIIGKKIRELRTISGISRETLAKKMDITVQQLQKYEVGGNRISASNLYKIANILKIPITEFFEDTKIEYKNKNLCKKYNFLRNFEKLEKNTKKSIRSLINNIAKNKEVEQCQI
jgi:transcriptional regulator with XRE-family HTH domain